MTLRNKVDDDRIKLFQKHQQAEYLRQCDMRDGGINDAQLVDEMRRDGTLKHLNPMDYEDGNGVPVISVGAKPSLETLEGYGFKAGDTVVVKIFWPWATEEAVRKVMTVLHDTTPAIRCDDGQVYLIRESRKAKFSDLR